MPTVKVMSILKSSISPLVWLRSFQLQFCAMRKWRIEPQKIITLAVFDISHD